MNYGKSGSQASQESGLRGTQYAGPQATTAYQAGQQAQGTASNILSNPMLFQGQTGQQLYGSGRYGLGFNVDPAIDQMIKQSYGLASAADASAGRLTPEGASAAAGSAVTNILPQLIPQLMQFGQYQFGLPMQLNTYAANVANQNANIQAGLLGTQGQSTANAFQFGFDPSGSSSSTSGGTTASKVGVLGILGGF